MDAALVCATPVPMASLEETIRLHGLWLLATVVAALLSFYFQVEGGILTQTLFPIVEATGYVPSGDIRLLVSIITKLDWAIPPAIMGFVLYYLVNESQAKRARN